MFRVGGLTVVHAFRAGCLKHGKSQPFTGQGRRECLLAFAFRIHGYTVFRQGPQGIRVIHHRSS